MPDDSDKLTPNEEQTTDRTPAACPMCGQSGAFDSMGSLADTRAEVRHGVETDYNVVWERFHCPECNATFEVRTEAETATVESGYL